MLRVYSQVSTLDAMIEAILRDYAFAVPYRDLEGDAKPRGASWKDTCVASGIHPDFDAVEMLRSVFYRNKGAYLVGRVRKRNRVIPIILPLLNTGAGIVVDAALFSEEEASVVFSFTRSYFHVDAEIPGDLVGFLKSILPLKAGG